MTIAAGRMAATVDLAAGCAKDSCLKWAWQLKHQLDPAYATGAAVMLLEGTFGEWRDTHRTARKRAIRAERLGYTVALIDRAAHVDDICRINTSAPVRQGHTMSAGYHERPVYGENLMGCPRHHVYPYGVLHEDRTLVGYLWLYRAGQLALVSSILGHADHLDRSVMYLLYAGMLRHQFPLGGTIFYNLWNSGTDGLRFFKERVGLQEGDVDWGLV